MSSDAMTSQAQPGVRLSDTTTRNPSGEDAALVCETVADLYSRRARLLAGRLLASFLEGHRAIPTELLHSPTLQKHLEGDRLWQSALQRTAEVQGKHLGIKASVRVTALVALTSEANKRTRALLQAKRPPEAKPGQFSDQVARLHATAETPADAAFLVDSALTQYLQGCRDWGEKVERILALWDGETLSETARGAVDAILEEVLRAPGALYDICERQDPLDLLLEDVLVMAGALAPETPLLEPESPEGTATRTLTRSPIR